jgi:hypothetical protein
MTGSRGCVRSAAIVQPHDAQRLGQACPDLNDWPRSWHVEPADIAIGQQIVELFAPFLLHLMDQRLAKTTVRRHRDNLWTLGGELLPRRYDDDELARQDTAHAIEQLIAGDGGPLMRPRMTEDEQDSLDATCRNLDRFLRNRIAATSNPD